MAKTASTDNAISTAYETLRERRKELTAQQAHINAELDRVNSALDSLKDLVDAGPTQPEAAAAPATSPAPKPTAAPEPVAATSNGTAEQAATSRRDRVSEVLLSKPRTWMTVAQIADLAEQGTSNTAERNAASELLRRMANQGEAVRDDSTRPVRYKAIPDALRQRRTDND